MKAAYIVIILLGRTVEALPTLELSIKPQWSQNVVVDVKVGIYSVVYIMIDF